MAIRVSAAATSASVDNEKTLSTAFKRDTEPVTRRGITEDTEDVAQHLDDGTTQVERAETLALQVLQKSLSISALNNGCDSMLALLQRLDTKQRFDKELRLARALSKLLAVAERWLDLVRTLEHALAAAKASKDRAAEAWALHELGTLRLAVGQLRAADAALTDAHAIREALGDRRAAAATSRNLAVLCRSLRLKLQKRQLFEARRLLRIFPALPLVLVIMVVAGGTAAAALALVVSRPPAPVVASISPQSGPPRGGTTVTIRGERLGRGSVVLFGRHRASVIRIVGDPSLIVIAPAGHGSVPVRIRTDGHWSGLSRAPRFTYKSRSPQITVAGSASPPAGGGVGVSSSSPGAVCGGSSCVLDSGGDVTLTATASSGYGFSGWSGGCAGQTGVTCRLTNVVKDASVTAVFGRHGTQGPPTQITVAGSASPAAGGGVGVSSSSPGAVCGGSSCVLDSGGDVTLTATASSGYGFSGWSGACAGQTGVTCRLTNVVKDASVTAVFGRHGTQGPPTQITVAGSASPPAGGGVGVSSSSPGAVCGGSSCVLDSGGDVTLTATASSGYGFSSWSGGCASQTRLTCTLTNVVSDEHATAAFAPQITVAGSASPPAGGGVGVSSSSPGAVCGGSSCVLDSGGDVTLTATASSGYGFSGWSGACASQTGVTCTLDDVASGEQVTATFEALFHGE